jgi:hypothetical protein
MSNQPKPCCHPGCTTIGLFTLPKAGGGASDNWLCEHHLNQLIYSNSENIEAVRAEDDLTEFRQSGGKPS